MKRKIKYEKPKLYLCNADKRPQCRGTACYKNGGPCRLTAHKEFEKHFGEDRFKDSLERVRYDCTEMDDTALSWQYDLEVLDMLIEALKNAEPVKCGEWIKGKYWDEWFCSVCRNGAIIDSKENPILSDYCPHCGTQMKKGE